MISIKQHTHFFDDAVTWADNKLLDTVKSCQLLSTHPVGWLTPNWSGANSMMTWIPVTHFRATNVNQSKWRLSVKSDRQLTTSQSNQSASAAPIAHQMKSRMAIVDDVTKPLTRSSRSSSTFSPTYLPTSSPALPSLPHQSVVFLFSFLLLKQSCKRTQTDIPSCTTIVSVKNARRRLTWIHLWYP